MNATTLARRTFLTGVVASAGVLSTRNFFARPRVESISEHLIDAAETIEKAIEPSLVPLLDFFKKARSGIPKFAESARGWISTGKLAWDALPFTANTRHKEYLRNEFDLHVFRATDLQSTIERCLNRFEQAIVSAESEMLVRLNADSPDLPSYPKKQIDHVALNRECLAIISRSEKATQESVVKGVSQLIIAEITQRVLTQVTASLARSLGLYGIGSMLAPETFGASIVAAILIDSLIGWIWNWFADPRGNLISELNRKIAFIESVLTEGTDGKGGLKHEMNKYAKERRSIRDQAVRNLLHGS